MKFIVSLLLTAVLSFLVRLYFPWWSIAIVALAVAALIPQKPLAAFFAGFFALFLLWLVLSAWISNANGHVLAHKISMIILKMDNVYLLMLASAFIGGIVAGLAALTGSFLRKQEIV